MSGRAGLLVLVAGLFAAGCSKSPGSSSTGGTATGTTTTTGTSAGPTGGTTSGSSTTSGSTSGTTGSQSCTGNPSICDPQLCNTQTGACVDCLSDADCTDGYNVKCDTAHGLCVECLSSSDCTLDEPGCYQGYCGSCGQAADCPSSQTCNLNESLCECHSNAGCGGDAPVCVPATKQCGCGNSSQCPSGLICDDVNYWSGYCVQPCTTTAGACDPNGSSPYCVTSTSATNYGLCVPCLSDSQCEALGEGPYCTSDGCVYCRNDADCQALDAGSNICIGYCVECGSAADCPVDNPGCSSSNHECGGCIVNSDCPDGSGCTPLGTCGEPCVEGSSTPNCAPCFLDSDCPSVTPYCSSTGVCGSTRVDAGNNQGPCGYPCGGDTVCDPNSQLCVGCLSDRDCNHPQEPMCDTNEEKCVQCITADDCPFDQPGCLAGLCGSCSLDNDCPAGDTCSANTGQCQCSSNAGCGGDAPVCQPDHACGCNSDSQCPANQICDAVGYTNGACVIPCTTDGGGCDPDGFSSQCDRAVGSATYGLCLPCLNDQQCQTSGQGIYCTSIGCTRCLNDAECAAQDAGTPFCATQCVQCLSYSDCSGNQGCNGATGRCGSCNASSDCPPNAHSCTSGTCH